MVIFFLCIFILLTGVFVYTTWIAVNKINQYEKWTHDAQDGILDVIGEMKRIDESGMFKSDDEVGDVFDALAKLIEGLSILTYNE
jgi:hypothetical protein